jgi:IclR family KDG regulon transcriptional repressor
VDKVDSAFDIKISSEIGMKLPLLAGAGGKALLSQLSDTEIEKILSQNKLKKFTRFSCVNREKYKKMIERTRQDGIAFDREEYIEGIGAFAVPLNIDRPDSQVAIWAVGLKRQITDEVIVPYSEFLKKIATEIEIRLSTE